MPIEVDHHFRHALFGGRNATVIMRKAKLTQERGLETVALQVITLDPRRHQRLAADQLDG